MSVATTPQAPSTTEHGTITARPLFDPPIVRRAIVDSFVKLNPVTCRRTR